jgi:hypothetical protein
VGDPADRAHGAGHDDHGVELRRAADEWHLHGGVVVFREPGRDRQLADFRRSHLARVGAQGDMDVVRTGRVVDQMVKKTLRVERAACPGDGQNQFHAPSV